MSMAGRLTWSSAARSDVGTVRKVNEDACLALPELGLWAVADGMGGHEAGDVASQMIIEQLRQVSLPAGWQDYVDAVKDRLILVNRRLREEAARRYHNHTIGSTVVILLAYQDHGACLWVGDSRMYRLRDGRLQQLTRDHSHVQDLIDQGLLRPEEAHRHPLANVITRAVGSGQELAIDMITLPLRAGDVYLLCSDGLTKAVIDAEIARLLARRDSAETVQALIQLALARGANDNVTAVVVHVEDKNDPDATLINPL